MPNEDDELRVYEQLVRTGVCPDCGGQLEPPRLPRAYTQDPPSGGWAGWRERTCYNCAETFGFYLRED